MVHRLTVLAVLCVALAAPQGVGPTLRAGDELPDWSGVYGYGDTATITLIHKGGGVYEYREDHGKNGLWVGVGLLKDGVMAIAWQKSTGGNLGVSQVKVEKGEKGPQLVGPWINYPLPGKGWPNRTLKYDPPVQFLRKLDR
jgi:hypothetical protein